MKTFTSAADLQSALREEKNNNKSIGYVATMGFLHEGHATLLEKGAQRK